jgi:hypothetical protein
MMSSDSDGFGFGLGGHEVNGDVSAGGRLSVLAVPRRWPESYRQGRGRAKGSVRTHLTLANSTPRLSSFFLS